MDVLFEQEELNFQPVEGRFDVARVGERIRDIGFSFQDESDPTMFMVCEDEESREHSQAQRRQAPEQGFPYVLLIRVEPGNVMVNQFAGPEFLDYSREFVGWLVENYRCRVSNESGTDLSAELSAS